ncbi:Gram-positive_LPXTG cell wall anchor [Hexamita inflata]|uniref:Gram-positive LPXTG cell wall anchor n=1 Tax=Hexamita inflata TaxID=28002 RepID=A0AA86UI04_9EUKA|nr:Gram-positive LPXTG cell wall anchor [Hexamita inflata]CAI9951942.1 Gram-positive LPXTG cell wall anchor [Hexamita inflata]
MFDSSSNESSFFTSAGLTAALASSFFGGFALFTSFWTGSSSNESSFFTSAGLTAALASSFFGVLEVFTSF